MKKVLILGATGMIGHQIFLKLKDQSHNVLGISTHSEQDLEKYSFFNKDNIIPKINFLKEGIDEFKKIIQNFNPEIIINASGIVKQKTVDPSEIIFINSYIPHKLYQIANEYDKNIKWIQISTDCVFDGKRGDYSEESVPNSQNLYGQSKILGEVKCKNVTIIRTSVYGHELFNKITGVLEWFLNEKEEVKGYTEAFFSGISTNKLGEVIGQMIKEKRVNSGLIHIHSKKISKYDLLLLFNKTYKCNKKITPTDQPKIDRTLISLKGGMIKSSHEEMINNMRGDFLNE